MLREHLLDRRLAARHRWVAASPLRLKSVAAHSYYVAKIARRICHLLKSQTQELEIDVLRALDMALMHDEPEAETGDIPLPVEGMGDAIKEEHARILKEEYALIPQGDYFVDLWREFNRPVSEDSLETQIVRVADAIAGYAECCEELNLGNREFQQFNDRYVMIIAQFDYDWFNGIRDDLGFRGISKRRRRPH